MIKQGCTPTIEITYSYRLVFVFQNNNKGCFIEHLNSSFPLPPASFACVSQFVSSVCKCCSSRLPEFSYNIIAIFYLCINDMQLRITRLQEWNNNQLICCEVDSLSCQLLVFPTQYSSWQTRSRGESLPSG